MLTTPTCRCPGGDTGVSTDRDRTAATPSVSQTQRQRLCWCLDRALFTVRMYYLSPLALWHSHSTSSRVIIISPGSSSTDRSATSSSSSDKGLWLADSRGNNFQLQKEKAVLEEKPKQTFVMLCLHITLHSHYNSPVQPGMFVGFHTLSPNTQHGWHQGGHPQPAAADDEGHEEAKVMHGRNLSVS